MGRVEKSIEIQAPVDKVFDFVTDWQNMSRFMERTYDWKPTTEETRGNGARVAHKQRSLGRETACECEISGFVENEGFTLTSFRGPEARSQWIFQRLGDGTRLTLIAAYEVPVPVVGGILDALLVKRMAQRVFNQSLRNLKRPLEG
jgi:uncharacterized membrane protein